MATNHTWGLVGRDIAKMFFEIYSYRGDELLQLKQQLDILKKQL